MPTTQTPQDFADKPRMFVAGDAVYARRAGNRTFAWYVIGESREERGGFPAAMAHREHGSQVDRYMLFVEIKHVDAGRWAA